MDEVLGGIGDVGFTLATIAANLFVILYSFLARPWKTASGIHIFSFMLVIALILDHASILLNFPQYPGHLWVRAVLYSAMAMVIIWRVLILLRVQLIVTDNEVKKRKSSPTR
jgi:hypothetical protein